MKVRKCFTPAVVVIYLGFMQMTAAAPGVVDEDRPKDQNGREQQDEREKQKAAENPFLLKAYKPNYLLPLSYNLDPNQTYEKLDRVEMKFQFSLKVSLWDSPFDTNSVVYFGYTQQSFWQAYNAKYSSPFRETNYEPEFFWMLRTDNKIFGMELKRVLLGVVHQSNGRAVPLSRSWNRAYLNFVLGRGSFYLSLKPWVRFSEDNKTDPLAAEGDDNPDILEYMGRGELKAFYRYRKNEFSLMLRNNFASPNYGAVQLDWAYPLGDEVKWYLQYFNGYGESLIDYNHRISRLGIGFLFSNWL